MTIKIPFPFPYMRACRRTLPGSFEAVPVRRRLRMYRELLKGKELSGQVEALRILLRLPRWWFNMISPADLQKLLGHLPWLKIDPAPKNLFPQFHYRGQWYHFAAFNFSNGTCREYPIADGYLEKFLNGDPAALLLLTATLYREKEEDMAKAIARSDRRIPLHSRMEVQERAKRMEGMPIEYQQAALLYFVGVKKMVFNLYGQWLFEAPPEDGEAPPTEGDGLGWHGLYMDAADGDMEKLEKIYQSSFHTFCLVEVRKRKQAKERHQKQRLAAADFGKK